MNFLLVGDTQLPAKKRLKTIEASENDESVQTDNEETKKSEMYQHIKEAKGKSEQILDTATKEQAEVQQDEEAMMEDDTAADLSENLPPESNEEKDAEISEVASQKLDNKREKKENKTQQQHPDG